MTFVTAGLAVAGLVAISIPIIVHLLFRRRRTPIEWAAMRFLIEAFHKHRRRLQLEQLLLLMLRCLILFLFGAALARPILEAGGFLDTGGARVTFLIIDNSLASSVNDSKNATALEYHIQQAITVIEELDAGDSIGVITASRPAKALLIPPSTDHHAVIKLLESLQSMQAPFDPAGALSELRDAIDEFDPSEDRPVVYLFSEFRSGSAAVDSPLPSVLAGFDEHVTLLSSPAAHTVIENVQITAIDPVRHIVLPNATDGSGQITVRLARHGGEMGPGVTRVRLLSDDLARETSRTVNWQPGQSRAEVDFLVDFIPAGDRNVALTAVIEHDALEADNQRFATIELRDRFRVVLIDRQSFGLQSSIDRLPAGQWINRALEPVENGPVEVIGVDPAALDTSDLRRCDMAILPCPDLLAAEGWPMLSDYVDRGGLLLICPPADANVHQWTDRLTSSLRLPWRINRETLNLDEPLALADNQPESEILRLIRPDLPDLVSPVFVSRLLPINPQTTQAGVVLELADGSPLFVVSSPISISETIDNNNETPRQSTTTARGLVAYLAVAPELSWSNLPAKPLMVPLVHELLRQGNGMIRASVKVNVGDQPNLGLGTSASEIVDAEGRTIVVSDSGRLIEPISQAGIYSIHDRAGQPMAVLPVNVDPSAGRTDVLPQAVISDWLGESGNWQTFDADDPAAAQRAVQSGSSLTGPLLLAVLILLVLETVLARRFSHAYQRSESDHRFGEHGSGILSAGSSAQAGAAGTARAGA